MSRTTSVPALDPGGDEPYEAAAPDLSERSAAHKGWENTVLVWAMAGDAMFVVEPGDWACANDGTATAPVDDLTNLRFSDGRLHASSRCRHAHIHRTTVEHPDDLAAVRRRAEECTGDEDCTA
ncbi:hypothetical protein AB0J01_27675 [Streptomyces sp. NPDC050204]|uniref:hypothetical protein n=1 Tax=Streptomyces sp. NPDC050204 TaxID=3155514 RepID=UPI003438B0E8